MSADRRRFGRMRGARRMALLGCAGLLAGCASMPDSGDVTAVKVSKPGDSQVQVYPVMPREGAAPDEIVDGFLEAMTGDDPGFATAREYLTKQAARNWRPQERTTVLAAAPSHKEPVRAGDPDVPGLVYSLHGRQVATVDRHRTYRPVVPAVYTETIHLVRVSGADGKGEEWRIDGLPQGMLLGESDFQRNYRPVNMYYFVSGRDWVVADPVYIRQRKDPVTRMDPVAQTVKALLEGPTKWLEPVADSRFPAGAALRGDVTSLTPDDQNELKVPLTIKAGAVGIEQCRGMAAQLLFTVGDLASTRVERVKLLSSDGSALCSLGDDEKTAFMADPLPGTPENLYFVDAGGKLAELEVAAKESGAPRHVPGPLGNGSVKNGSVAVARDERYAATVTADGRTLRVASLVSDTEPPETLLTSRGGPGNGLSAPSWDGRGDLWVADRDPARSRLLLIPEGSGEPLVVRTPWLGDGVRVEALRVSEDGVRIALLLQKNGRTTLHIGRVERHGSGAGQSVAVTDLQSVAPRMESVTSVSWAGPSRLVVLGRLAGGVQQVRYIRTDGTTSAGGVPGLSQVRAVAAANDERAPLVAASDDDGIVRLQSGANWQPMADKGSSPVYPG